MHYITLIEDRDRQSLKVALEESSKGDLLVTTAPPPPDLDLVDILQTRTDLFLVDYELDTIQEEGTIAAYRGTTLAAHLREARPEFPIVLLTRSDLPIWESQRRVVEASRMYDDIMYKTEQVQRYPQDTYNSLVTLADGYRRLREQHNRNLSGLLDLLNTDEEGQLVAIDAMPPEEGWEAIEASFWIRNVLLKFPGVLYNSMFAATALGMSEDSFQQSSVQEFFKDAIYNGPFQANTKHWWKHSLFNIASNLVSTKDNSRGLREQFLHGASHLLNTYLEPSRDPQSGTDYADTVCYLLNIPIRIETSLPYRPDNRPAIMDEARVSFKAIRETNDVDDNHFDSASRMMATDLRRMST